MRTGTGLLVLVAAVLASCGADAPVSSGEVSTGSAALGITESEHVRARIGELRARFASGRRVLALDGAVATFERSDTGGLRAVLPASARRGVRRAASVELPMQANGESRIEDETSHVSVCFRLLDAKPSAVAVGDGYALYEGALDGGDVVHRVYAEGTEDYVVFETRPAREELRYDVDVARVPGLRLVSNTLEFLDERGSPALRVSPPYLVDARGALVNAQLAVTGCVVDANGAAPWGGPMTAPGADRCTVHVSWTGATYPAIVDPAWGATGSMSVPRADHTATKLPSGRVLVAGGNPGATAELFDPAASGGIGAFAATGGMTTGRSGHTASLLPSGKVLVAGGVAVSTYLSSAEIYDPSANGGAGGFVATGSMAAARTTHTANVLASGKVLVAGGFNGGYLASAELFDPVANAGAGAFAATGSLATARANHSSSVLKSGKVFVAGGESGAPLASAELFDPAANAGAGAFGIGATLVAARTAHTASVLASGKVLIAGGFNGTDALASAEIFDPAANAGAGASTSTGSMSTARYQHTASVLASGEVLVTGGVTGDATAESFNPASSMFASAGVMAAARKRHTATVLSVGALIAGGLAAGGQDLTYAVAEIFAAPLGEACVVGACRSGFCVDGVCCDTACGTGGCDRCDLPGKKGTCTIAPAGNPGTGPACPSNLVCDGVSASCPASCASDVTCAPAYYCAKNGTCEPRKAQAAACDPKTNCKQGDCRECTSGHCVDGFCCDTACVGTCQACAATLKQSGLANGTCGATKEGVDPRMECEPATGALCGPDGMCNGAGGCHLFTPAGVTCGPNGLICDGSGSCRPPAAATCDGDHTKTNVDGTTENCAPYKCESNGSCRTACTSVADCVAPSVCDPSNQCVLLSQSEGDTGCSVSAAPHASTPGWSQLLWLGLGLATLAVRKRRIQRIHLNTESDHDGA